jgi:hypothetical protein
VSWTDRIAKKVADLLREDLQHVHTHIDDAVTTLHVHLDAATTTLTAADEPEGTLTPEDRQGLHALRGHLGARYNPPPITEEALVDKPNIVEAIQNAKLDRYLRGDTE